jgi:hypothetical protein
MTLLELCFAAAGALPAGDSVLWKQCRGSGPRKVVPRHHAAEPSATAFALVWPPFRAALLVTQATRGRCSSRGGLRPTDPTFTSTGKRATLDTALSPSLRIGVVAASAAAEEQARRAFAVRDQNPPPRVKLSFWQLFCAARNAGALRSIPLEGLILRPCEVGSGKFGTPCARMHLA